MVTVSIIVPVYNVGKYICKSLFDSCEEWAIAIESQLQVGRANDALENLSDEGWDIQDAAEKLEQIYSM